MKKIIKTPFVILWKIWFYILVFSTLIIISPILLILTAKESYYPILWKIIRMWSKFLLFGMGFYVKTQFDEQTDCSKSYLFCPNHTSFIDPFVLISLSKNPIVFVGKKELVKIPIFGFFYKKAVIMVDRSSAKSKRRVYKMVKKRLQNGTSVAIFPEGLVPSEDVILAPFKKGAFGLAIEFEIPIVPQVYYDCKRFFSWDFFKGGPGKIRIKQHQFIQTKGLKIEDMNRIKQQTFDLIYNDLTNDQKYMKDTNRNS